MGFIAAWAALQSFQILTSETFRGFHDIRLASIFGGVITGSLSVLLNRLDGKRLAMGWFRDTMSGGYSSAK